MSIERLPGTPSTPLFTLHKLLESVDQIESLVVVVAWKDSEDKICHQVCWSAQGYGRLAVAAIACHDKVTREIMR